jgi:GAF domain-containing protein
VLATGRPVTVEHFRHDERVAKVARENLNLGPAIVFPLGGPGNVRGVLTVDRRPGSMPLAQAAVELVTNFAAQAGIALELAEHREDPSAWRSLRTGTGSRGTCMTWLSSGFMPAG